MAWDASWNRERPNSTVPGAALMSRIAIGRTFNGKMPLRGRSLATRRDEFEGIAVALDMAGVEMPADHQHRPVGKA